MGLISAFFLKRGRIFSAQPATTRAYPRVVCGWPGADAPAHGRAVGQPDRHPLAHQLFGRTFPPEHRQPGERGRVEPGGSDARAAGKPMGGDQFHYRHQPILPIEQPIILRSFRQDSGLSPQLPSAICNLPMKIVLDKIWRQADSAIQSENQNLCQPKKSPLPVS